MSKYHPTRPRLHKSTERDSNSEERLCLLICTKAPSQSRLQCTWKDVSKVAQHIALQPHPSFAPLFSSFLGGYANCQPLGIKDKKQLASRSRRRSSQRSSHGTCQRIDFGLVLLDLLPVLRQLGLQVLHAANLRGGLRPAHEIPKLVKVLFVQTGKLSSA